VNIIKERLIELLHQAEIEWISNGIKTIEYALKEDLICQIQTRQEFIVDYLLKNGVIVPPCKVGDTVYEALTKVNHIRSNKVVGFHLGKFPNVLGHKRKEYLVCYSDYSLTHINIEKFGKTVFLTKKEAEQALKGGKE